MKDIFFHEHAEHNAQDGDHGGYRGCRQQRSQTLLPVDIGQTDDPPCDGCADIGSHDDADCLRELHQSGIDEPHHHDGGGTGTLDQGRDDCPQQKPLQGGAGQFVENQFQLVAGHLFQAFAHELHAIQKQGHAGQQCQNCDNGAYTHTSSVFVKHRSGKPRTKPLYMRAS